MASEKTPPIPSSSESAVVDDAAESSGSLVGLPTPIPDSEESQIVFTDVTSSTKESDALQQTDPTTGGSKSGVESKPQGEQVDVGGDADPDAEGEIIEVEQVIGARRAFPSFSPNHPEADLLPPQSIHQASTPTPQLPIGQDAWKLLPEIARLAREMVKNGEEKVAVAQGAYNSVSHLPRSPNQSQEPGVGLTR